MRKVALAFVLAVLVPSLVLAWLAVRSLRDQQFLMERQQSLLYQGVTDALAQNISAYLTQRQEEFGALVENLAASQDARHDAPGFDDQIRRRWPFADVGFCVTSSGHLLCPPPNSRSEAQRFALENGAFLGNREIVEVYSLANNNDAGVDSSNRSLIAQLSSTDKVPLPGQANVLSGGASQASGQNNIQYKAAVLRKISPQNQPYQALDKTGNPAAAGEQDNNLSRVIPAETGFAQLIGTQTDGLLARFLQNRLQLMFWHRLGREPDLVYGAQLNLARVVDGLRGLVQPDPALRDEICLVLLDDNARPVIFSHGKFLANWKRPFVATEIGDALPHWEVAAYLADPSALTRAACITNVVIGLLIALLVLTIILGSWLIVRNLNLELTLARQQTDFVSNVSHELKTPLTSIRMFSELLATGRVADEAKQQSYLNIISAEAARLTRLINNVLDFSHLERGEKKYQIKACDLTEVVRATAESFRPHLEANGFKFDCELSPAPVVVQGDADALSQIIVNLLSNAEKYSNGAKEIRLQLAAKPAPQPRAEITVLDRGSGVPAGCEEKVFEKFYRAHDSLSSGIQGSGLGLTIARQIARAHGGDVVCAPRPGGGSCFILRLPVKSIETTKEHK